MTYTKQKLAAGLLTVASLGMLSTSQAFTFAEPGDVGQTIATASAAGAVNGTTGLTQITGTIGTSTDADLYSFTLSSSTALSFAATSVAGIDTSLFLFSSTGVPLLANDDQSVNNFEAAFTTGTLAAGTYYLGVSLSGNEPVNTSNQLLFTADQPTTNVRGPASGLNPTVEGDFNAGTFFAETGDYAIGIAAVPEPGTWALLGLGVAALGLARRRSARA